jgi:hypothetical protein
MPRASVIITTVGAVSSGKSISILITIYVPSIREGGHCQNYCRFLSENAVILSNMAAGINDCGSGPALSLTSVKV